MKKLLAILLCIVMMLSMVACGGNQDNNETPNNDQGNAGVSNEKPTGEPSDEEKNAIGLYSEAVDALNAFAEDGVWANLSFDCQKYGVDYEGDEYILYGAAAAEKYYEFIANSTVVDKWVGSDYLAQFYGNWDRQSVLDSFVIVEDVKLSENYTVYDPVGNTKNLEMTWQYDAEGKLGDIRWDSEIGERYQYAFVFDAIEVDPLHLLMQEDDHRAEPVYDAAGKVTELKVIGGGETMYLGTISYDSNGKVSSATVTSAYGDKGTLTYSYNDQNQLIEVSYQSDNLAGNVYYENSNWEGYGEKDLYSSSSFTYTYTYNADGKVATKTYSGYSQWDSSVHSVVTEYSYDAAGNLAGAVCERKYNSQSNQSDVRPCTIKDTYTFACDAQGNPVSVTINCGDAVYESYTKNSESSKIEIECVYGDLYIYNPAK